MPEPVFMQPPVRRRDASPEVEAHRLEVTTNWETAIAAVDGTYPYDEKTEDFLALIFEGENAEKEGKGYANDLRAEAATTDRIIRTRFIPGPIVVPPMDEGVWVLFYRCLPEGSQRGSNTKREEQETTDADGNASVGSSRRSRRRNQEQIEAEMME